MSLGYCSDWRFDGRSRSKGRGERLKVLAYIELTFIQTIL